MANTATRLITLIMLLQRQPNQKAADLAAKLGVSVRSLHRYMTMLDELGIPVYSERGPYGGFSLVRGYKMPPLIFTPSEAVALALGAGLAGEVWGRLYDEAARAALAKLDNVLPEEQRHEVDWARRTLLAIGLQRSSAAGLAPLLETLRQAVREQRSVSVCYQAANQAVPAARTLDPYALLHRGGWWYVIGRCHLRRALRSFRLDRIAGVALTDQRFTTPPDFDARAYVEDEFKGQPAVRARLRFAPEMAHLARNSSGLWDSLEDQADGSVLACLTMPDLTWAASTVLSFGPAVTVEEPEELRRTVKAWAEAVAAAYE